MGKNFDPQFSIIDSLIISNEWSEWDHVRYLIGEELKGLEVRKRIKPEYLPFIAYFEGEIKGKLIKAGFEKDDIINNQERLEIILKGLDNQGTTIYGVWNYPPFAYGYPADTVILNDNKSMYWIKPEIEAALRALESLSIIKGMLVKGGLVNKEAARVYLRSLELIINLSKAGNIPKLACAEIEKKEKSIETREIKKKLMRKAVENIFKKFPHSKTLGAVWNKFDIANKGITFLDGKTKKKYHVKTGKDAKGEDIVIITGDVTKPLEYAKRSIQHFINELKQHPS